MGIRNYFWQAKQRLMTKIKTAMRDRESIFDSYTETQNTASKNSSYIVEHKNIISNNKVFKKESIISSNQFEHFPLPSASLKDLSTEISETSKNVDSFEPNQSIPEGSRVLSINLMRGEIVEKVYLTPNGEKVSLKTTTKP